jgi:hypothetical protein
VNVEDAMQISFVETMRGTLTDEGGGTHPIAFELKAIRIEGGRFDLSGVIFLPPFAREAAAQGTLAISPFAITYRLSFRGDRGDTLALDAEKHPSPLSPLRSMTEMEATIRDAAGRRIAHGPMTFDLRDLFAFAVSWLPIFKTQQRALDVRRRAIVRQLLSGG